ncbi:MAG: GreA/GreB family elongation factor [Bdellovibrionales bacterium]|nr:GreA/GreB family elongation factor [Bdellovibrionales bacterium]
MPLKKQEIYQKIIESLEQELNTMIQSAKNAKDAATNEESKAENKYDTRGLEASYLAGAQAKRATELREMINLFKTTPVQNYDSTTPIGHTALVKLQHDDHITWYFVAPQEGGLTLHYQDYTIFVISPFSPVGQALMGRKQGDEFELEIKNEIREYEIISVQ